MTVALVQAYTRGLGRLNEADDFGFLLLDGAYTFDATEEFVSDLVAYETAATDYARSTPTTLSLIVDDVNGYVYFDIADPTFGTIAADDSTPQWVIFYGDGGSDGASPLIWAQGIADGGVASMFPGPVRVAGRGVARYRAGLADA